MCHATAHGGLTLLRCARLGQKSWIWPCCLGQPVHPARAVCWVTGPRGRRSPSCCRESAGKRLCPAPASPGITQLPALLPMGLSCSDCTLPRLVCILQFAHSPLLTLLCCSASLDMATVPLHPLCPGAPQSWELSALELHHSMLLESKANPNSSHPSPSSSMAKPLPTPRGCPSSQPIAPRPREAPSPSSILTCAKRAAPLPSRRQEGCFIPSGGAGKAG